MSNVYNVFVRLIAMKFVDEFRTKSSYGRKLELIHESSNEND